jgi:acyl-CoA synthetase (AMP-forming)/AMP-acid ligase II
MPQDDARSLAQELSAGGELATRFLAGPGATVRLRELKSGACFGPQHEALRGRSVLLAVRDPLAAALAMIALDGLARRMVLCPADLPWAHVASVMATAEVDAVLSDDLPQDHPARSAAVFVTCEPRILPAAEWRGAALRTEWIVLTSGTTGVPKLVVHGLASLAGPVRAAATGRNAVWSTFYDIRRYGGLAIFFRALLGGASLVLSGAEEPTGAFLERAAAQGVTHISGTPSHWRRALMSSAARNFNPHYVRLSGEIADQAILDQLRALYPAARIVHAFASTEAGLAFEVDDGLAGFPGRFIGTRGGVTLAVADGSLRVRGPGAASRYLGLGPLADRDGFIDTNDIVELRGDRYFFVGRRDGVINVGGLKVYPEEVEAVVNAHPAVRMARVIARPNPFTGAVVAAEIVLRNEPGLDKAHIERELLETCRRALPRHKVPAAIRFVASLAVSASGKLSRQDA